jgi:hypothetical protein
LDPLVKLILLAKKCPAKWIIHTWSMKTLKIRRMTGKAGIKPTQTDNQRKDPLVKTATNFKELLTEVG